MMLDPSNPLTLLQKKKGAAPAGLRHVGPPDLETPQLPEHAHVGAAIVVAYGHRLAGSQTLEPPSDYIDLNA